MHSHLKRRRKTLLLPMCTVLLCTMLFMSVTSISTYAAGSDTAGYTPVTLSLNQNTLYRRGAIISGEVYVEMYSFLRIFSSCTYSLSGNAVTVYARGLTVTGAIGEPYIEANGRILYSGKNGVGLNNALWVPLAQLAKATGLSYSRTSDTAVSLTGYYNPLESGETYYDAGTVYWLAKIIQAESGAEPMLGKIAVGNVVLNRVRSSEFPNTVYSVIFDTKNGVQFSPVSNGTIYRAAESDAKIAAKICLEGYTVSSKILYFYHPAYQGATSWASLNRPYAFTIGGHQFFN